ncbi:AMP-dependent synthetase [Mycolicibacterium mucogenicum]|uniref:AMP-dependent synthetase n=1 Tax=Mycolicibacterium mucogenicum TaxID=56689 RepID=A0A1A3H9X4_MYCMU|nr:AMP-binding protein [Mycolicibacterium mucogenicum]OBJ44835.1 AMP-dependent synthetase [Mycolicibacterium mucogenicum]
MSYRSPNPDVDIPNVSVYEYLFGSIMAADLDRTALVDSDSRESFTYRQLLDQIDRVAGGLAARGLTPGDVVAIYSHNTPRFAAVLHGVLRAGGAASPINALYTVKDVAEQLRKANAKFLFTTSQQYSQAVEAAGLAGVPRGQIITIDDTLGCFSLQNLIDLGARAPKLQFDPAKQVAVLTFSSGTTSTPKGVQLTHRNLVANIAQTMSPLAITKEDVVLGLLPFFHIYGLTVLLNLAFKCRTRVVTVPRFELERFLRIVEDHRLTYLFIAPPVAVHLATDPRVDAHDVSSIRVIMSGAAPLDAALGRRVQQRLGARVVQGYGMSELSPVSHAIPVGRDDIDLNSVGLPVANTENRLVDLDSGREIERPLAGLSVPGELWIKGPNVMKGYLDNSEATSNTIDEDGYLHTGDIAVFGHDGSVFIVDRLKELIKYKGYQVAPSELEAVLLDHPDIVDAAVIGVKDATGEEVPKAFVVRRPQTELDGVTVIDFVSQRVSPHKKVRSVAFVDIIPKSASGKVLRRELRAMDIGSPARASRDYRRGNL